MLEIQKNELRACTAVTNVYHYECTAATCILVLLQQMAAKDKLAIVAPSPEVPWRARSPISFLYSRFLLFFF